MICSILSVDVDGRLHPLAGPSLPKAYCSALDGLRIGPDIGSCGTAAFRGEAVEVQDIATDPLWTNFRDLALPLGLRACWSSPIHAAEGRVVGTFAFYYRSIRGPSTLDRTIVEACVSLCSIALEQEERKTSIYRLAYFDALTGVANRASFERYAQAALAPESPGLTIHWMDLDNFKKINDTLGHQAGDGLLRTVANRIAATLKSGESLFRIGGDEFVVLQPTATDPEDIADLARRLTAAADQPVDLGETTVSIAMSIGVAQAPRDGADLNALMKKADLALYEAKSLNESFRVFDDGIEARIASRWQVEQDLRPALARNEFELFFQPIVDLKAVEISGFEVLIRWRRPGHGLLAPVHFLDIAEKSGLICEIGDWVLRESCRLGATLPPHMRIAVNLSPTQLLKPGFSLDVAKALSMCNLAPWRLELEITESALLLENAATLTCLNEIRQLGVAIALDDFGTGYSAISHLRAFPVDRIKIDRSFVQEVDKRPETASIICAIIGLAHELGLKTTAEGIETPAQLRMLNGFGCDEIQGYLISRPKPLEAFQTGADDPRRARDPVRRSA